MRRHQNGIKKYISCICEGAAENAIIDILLDNNLVIFTCQEILDKILFVVEAQKFEKRHLHKGFNDLITIIRILDSRRENLRLSPAYQNKVDVVNVITASEIEMLIIHNENEYNQFKHSGKKPSDFCKQDLQMCNIKSYDFVKDYFSNPQTLVNAIKKY